MEKVTVASFNLVGIAVRTINAAGRADKEIPALWQRFMAENIGAKIPNKLSEEIYAMYTDYVSDHTEEYTTILGYKVASLDGIPEGMVGHAITGGDYVKLTTRGNLEDGIIIEQWRKIWAADLNRVFTADFELFGEKAKNPADAEVEFFIAVEN